MFAIAIFDAEKRTLSFARDRLGEKPLYIAQTNNCVVFASDLAAIRQHPEFTSTIDTAALSAYFANANVPAPLSIYQKVRKLEPGHLLVLSKPISSDVHSVPFWSLSDVAAEGSRNVLSLSDSELKMQLNEKLIDAASSRMISDVPLGAFLSGGIDSSLVVALMQHHANNGVKTFSIGFNQADYNEAHHAKAVAEYLGTDHTELYVDEERMSRFLCPAMVVMNCSPGTDVTLTMNPIGPEYRVIPGGYEKGSSAQSIS